MVVTYTPSFSSYLSHEKEIRKQYFKNAAFRTDVVYKECSYRIPPKDTNTKQISDKRKMHKSKPLGQFTANHFSWSKVYESPVQHEHASKHIHDNIVIDTSVLDVEEIPIELLSLISEPIVIKNRVEEPNQVTIETRESKVAFPIPSATKDPKFSSRKSKWAKVSLPRLLCPCCTGPDENIDAYQTTAASYEIINLKPSNPNVRNLDLDASLLSLLQMHGNLKQKKTPKIYAKIAKILLRNTFKNAVYLLEPLKGI